jgi:hypothetical protein
MPHSPDRPAENARVPTPSAPACRIVRTFVPVTSCLLKYPYKAKLRERNKRWRTRCNGACAHRAHGFGGTCRRARNLLPRSRARGAGQPGYRPPAIPPNGSGPNRRTLPEIRNQPAPGAQPGRGVQGSATALKIDVGIIDTSTIRSRIVVRVSPEPIDDFSYDLGECAWTCFARTLLSAAPRAERSPGLGGWGGFPYPPSRHASRAKPLRLLSKLRPTVKANVAAGRGCERYRDPKLRLPSRRRVNREDGVGYEAPVPLIRPGMDSVRTSSAPSNSSSVSRGL